MEKHKEIMGYLFLSALVIVSIMVLSWPEEGQNSETREFTKGMSPHERLRAAKESVVEEDTISAYANEDTLAENDTKNDDDETAAGSDDGDCNQDRRLLGECEGNDSTGNSNSTNNKNSKRSDNRNTDNGGGEDNKPVTSGNNNDGQEVPQTTQLDFLAEVTSGSKEKRIIGVERTLPDRNIKAGCRFIGVIQDAIRVNSGFDNSITINIRSPYGRCRLPVDSLKLRGTAKMYNLETGITAQAEICTVPTSDLASQSCKATIESVTGSDVLEGYIYDQGGWGIFFDALIATGTAPFLAKISETAASATNYWAAESAGIAGKSLAKAIERIIAKINKHFEGTEVRVPENAVVIVTFDEDVIF